ncbi:cupin domain-containing protein [uncultured Roseovarius sp.]|uniref:cupin domain-containing protein n=1 Tax=uncultured Roseovarius sp. TaxID=293344 RepID=UPI002638E365|nr:cupin domain-containing protein [uncultured Roseovarius sp.]
MAEIFRNSAPALPRPKAETLVRRTQEAAWQETGTEGFLIKPLYEDTASAQRTWLMKVEPGALAPSHAHDETEQIYVIEGTFYDQENTYGPGDFAIRAPGVMHTGGSKHGAIVMLVYS